MPQRVAQQQGCPFCFNQIKENIVASHNSVVAIKDAYPVTPDHLLILPKRHVESYFLLYQQEKADIDRLLATLSEKIRLDDPTVTGFNIGVNIGDSAGQTISHCHIHLIPRRDGDTPQPRGGVRGVIPNKMNYQTDE